MRYAADLVPEIADDVVNIDNAIRLGFNWVHGPFEMLDHLGPQNVIDRIESEGGEVPAMLQVLRSSDAETFYRNNGTEFFGSDGSYHAI